ncbi:MAG: hypothetical protein ING40_00800 [Burkholderiales bacterium]|nr:hypothetical protein [Burkholderiales bacterium]
MNEPTELCYEVLIEARMHLLDRFLTRGTAGLSPSRARRGDHEPDRFCKDE